MRKNYRIKPYIKFWINTTDYVFCFMPTILWQPWRYRSIGSPVLVLSWLNVSLGLGEWAMK